MYPKNRMLTMEKELVFSSIRVDSTHDDRMQDLLRHDLNWSAIRQSADYHHVLPLLYKRLKTFGVELVPTEELSQLQILYLTNVARNLHKATNLLQVMSLLSKHGIESLPLKGPSLAVQLYSNLSLRVFSDLDILIHEKDFYLTCELLKKDGYRQELPTKPNKEKRLIKSGYDLLFVRQGISLELHWEIPDRLQASPVEPEQFWQRLEQVQLLDTDIWVLSPETLLLFLCHHGTKHQWGQLKLIADIARLVQIYPDLDFLTLLNKVSTIGFKRAFYLGLLLAERLGGARLPIDVSEKISTDPNVEKLFIQVLNKSLIEEPLPGRISGAVFFFQSRERSRDWFTYVQKQIVMPRQRDWMVVDLPDFLYPLYYLIRPFRLLYLIASRFLHSLFGQTKQFFTQLFFNLEALPHRLE